MKLSTREDIEAPIDHVFAQVSDFEALERSALRRGAEVQRIDALARPGPGMAWDSRFDLRGKRREMRLELTEYDPPNALRFAARSTGAEGEMLVDLVALSRGRTRMAFEIEIRPLTLAARLMVQSLKLAKGNVAKRFEMRVATYARDIEDRYARRG